MFLWFVADDGTLIDVVVAMSPWVRTLYWIG